MYMDTRLQAAAARGENRRAKAKMLLASKAGGPTVQQNNTNRRALGDIGNLVGALSARCIVSKESLQHHKQVPQKVDGELANDPSRIGVHQCNEDHILAQSTYDIELPVSWRTKQRRTMERPTRRREPPHVQVKVPDNNVGLLRGPSVNGSTAAYCKKKPTLTATLATLSEAACGGLEVEMQEAQESFPNIDEDDAGNQQAVVDYVEDIYSFYRKTEIQSCVAPDYMSHQADINANMRAILVDWLIEVHLKFKLMPETLYLTTNLVDRYLARESVLRKNLQLVGVTAMLLACKYEEIWAPEVRDFVFISDNAYTREQVLHMEKEMLNKLCFNLTVPTPYVFLVRFLKAAGSDTQLEMTAFFLTELCLTEYNMMGYGPSLLAAAAVYTALQTLRRTPSWSFTLQGHTGYTDVQLRDCVTKMVGFHAHAKEGNLTVVHKKYSNPKFNSVAALEPALFLVKSPL